MTISSFSYFTAYDISEYLTPYQKLPIYKYPYNLYKETIIGQKSDVIISTEYISTEKIGFSQQNFLSDGALTR
ncbi:MAG: hypothetical protein ACXWFC_12815 [Nitrososphaeraceae archaeon]